MTASGVEQREIHYSGRVQGVGFRYTVRSLASRTAVTGFVKNLPDGRVQLVVEGPPDEIRVLVGSRFGRRWAVTFPARRSRPGPPPADSRALMSVFEPAGRTTRPRAA